LCREDELAVRHGLTVVLHRHLVSLKEDIPEEIQEQLKVQAVAVMQRNMAKAGVLVEVARHLETADIPVIAFKGPTLALQLYGNLGLRPFNDLDVLVRETDLERAGEILKAAGFRLDPKVDIRFINRRARGSHTEYERGLVKLEVHYALFHNHWPEEPEAYWGKGRSCLIAGHELQTLGLEDQIMHLCLHGSLHGFSCLKWLLDLAVLLDKKYKVNWDSLLEKAKAHQARHAFLLGFYLIERVLKRPLPEPLYHAVKEEELRLARLARQCQQMSFSRPGRDQSLVSLARIWLRLQLLHGFRRKERMLRSMVFTPCSLDWAKIPWLSPNTPVIFSIVRIMRLFGKYGPWLLSLRKSS